MSTYLPAYAQSIRRLRKARRWTQERLGAELHYSGRMVSRWESGMVEPSIPALMGLAKLFAVSVDSILGFRTD